MDKSYNVDHFEDHFSLKKMIRPFSHHNGKKIRAKTGIKVFIPKKVGRVIPKHIQTDHFNLAAFSDTVNNISKTVDSVGSIVNTAATTYNTIKTNTSTAGHKPVQNPNPNINNGYNTNNPTVQQLDKRGVLNMPIDSNMLLMLVGGILVLVVVTMFLRKK